MIVTEDTTLVELQEARNHLDLTITRQREELREQQESISRNLDRMVYLEAEIEDKENA